MKNKEEKNNSAKSRQSLRPAQGSFAAPRPKASSHGQRGGGKIVPHI